ncbi:SymE family type I addiction module toxin [Citrobacter sp. FDAARGOS_156]|uniref:SymE family type I addiction module toxin n=1 Tax=Citrobacter sp. FDAARGOS_156 TaxID=1702170 RepID=UPI00351C4CB1
MHATALCKYYSRAVHNAIFLRSEWVAQAGFICGMPIKIRVMPDCIVITTQNTRELRGYAEGLSVVPTMEQWIGAFPGALNDTGDLSVYRRGDGHFG